MQRKHLKSIFDEFNVEQDLENEKFILIMQMVLSTDINKIFFLIIQKNIKEKNILEFQQYPLKSLI